MQRIHPMTLLACLALGAACGDDEGGGDGGGGGSNVAASKKITDLTPAEAQSLCQSFNQRQAQLAPTACKLAGAFAGAFAPEGQEIADCEAEIASCVREPATSCDLESSAPTCDVTVGEMERCMSELYTALGRAYAPLQNLDCAGLLMNPDLLGGFGETQTPAACATIEEKCPDIGVGPDDGGDG